MRLFSVAVLSAGLLAAGVPGASAADIYEGSLKDAPLTYSAPIGWGGFYVGGHFGVGFDGDCEVKEKNKITQTAVVYVPVDKCKEYDDDNFFLGGIHAGYNWEKHGPYIFGIEVDASTGDNIDLLASLRARLGYAMDDLLIYATAGVAHVKYDEIFGDNDSDNGFVFGAGLERKLRDDLSIGFEGLYYAFDDHEHTDHCEHYTKDGDFWSVRARLTYHLVDNTYHEPLK